MKAIIHAPTGPVTLDVFDGRKGEPSTSRTLRHYVFWNSRWYRVYSPGDAQMRKGNTPATLSGSNYGHIEGKHVPGRRLKVSITDLL